MRPAKSLQRYPLVVECLRVTVAVPRREIIGSEGFLGTSKLLENIAAIELRFRVWRAAPGGFLISGERIFVTSELLQHGALVEQI